MFVFPDWAVDDDGCRTPGGGVGSCQVIKSCEPILDFIRASPKPLSPKSVATLQAYQCGFQGSDVKVCCPDRPIPLVDNHININDSPPDVTNHKNFNLLPLTTCGPLPNDDRIIGGANASLFEFPWMALLSYQTSMDRNRVVCFRLNESLSLQSVAPTSDAEAPSLTTVTS